MNAKSPRNAESSKALLSRFYPVLTFIVVVLVVSNWWRIDLLINPIDAEGIPPDSVVLYSTSWCPYCRKARQFLQQANIPFTEYDVEESPRAYQQYMKISGKGVPVITVGKQVIQGYDHRVIRSALSQYVELHSQ